MNHRILTVFTMAIGIVHILLYRMEITKDKTTDKRQQTENSYSLLIYLNIVLSEGIYVMLESVYVHQCTFHSTVQHILKHLVAVTQSCISNKVTMQLQFTF